MEEEDRSKKLAAGKQKLAAFRKKRAKKKTATDDVLESAPPQNLDSTPNENGANANGVDSRCADVSTASDLNDIVSESDPYSSFTSGDEWSGEESDLHAAVRYQTKYVAAMERVADLEEAVQGKQLALDRMVLELQDMSNASPIQAVEKRVSETEIQNHLNGSAPEIHDALVQRDTIIRQLTARLQESVALKGESDGTEDVDYAEETHRLSQQVVLLQQQLAQAGATVQQQLAMCQMSVRSLQEAKAQIMALQGKVTEKNSLLQHLTLTLTSTSSQVTALRTRESELVNLVQVLQAQGGEGKCSEPSGTKSLEQELERLGSEHAQSVKAMDELRQRLVLSETSRQALINEKEEALGKILGLEEELNQLGQVRDEAMRKLSGLEVQVHAGSSALGAQCGGCCTANEKVAELERALADLNAQHSAQVHQVTLAQSSPEADVSVEDMGLASGDMSGLKNLINSQQKELSSLCQQLANSEDRLLTSREETGTLQEQLDSLREEKARYKHQMAYLEDEVTSFKDSLTALFTLPAAGSSDQTSLILAELNSEMDLGKRLQLLHRSYTSFAVQYADMLKTNQQLTEKAQSASDTAADAAENGQDIYHLTAVVSRLQEEVDQWRAVVQEKDSALDVLNSKLQEVTGEKESVTSHAKLLEEMTEQRTLDSDTLHRKLETSVNTLFSELSGYKEALKESEAANLELQEKVDLKSSETDSLKLQAAVSEDLLKEMQSKASMDGGDLTARLEQAQAELLAAAEDSKTLSLLRATLEERDVLLAAAQRDTETALEEARLKESKHENDLKDAQLQLEQHQAALTEKEQLVTAHKEEILRLEENFQQKTKELDTMLSEKEQTVSTISSAQEKQAEEMQEKCLELERKSHELHEIVADKEKLLSELTVLTGNKEVEIGNVKTELEQKSREMENLLSELSSVQREKETEMSAQLEVKAKEAEQALAEKEQLIASLSSSESERSEQLGLLQETLAQKTEENQTLLSEKENLVSQLSLQLSASNDELTNIHEQLQQKGQECEIMWAENERCREEAHSLSASATKEAQRLKQDLEQQTHKFQILMSEWQNLETDLHSGQSAFNCALQNYKQKLEASTRELEDVKGQLSAANDSAASQGQTVTDLNAELEQLKAQLAMAQAAGDETLNERQQAWNELQGRVHELEQEVHSKQEENTDLLTRLTAQSELFKVKEEEMVAENNALNHQLEEVRNIAEETASRLQREHHDLQEELRTSSALLQSQDTEFENLREESFNDRQTLDSLNASIVDLTEERDKLVAQVTSLKQTLKDSQGQVNALKVDIDDLKEYKGHHLSELEKEIDKREQLETGRESLLKQQENLLMAQESMQQDFSSQLEFAQSQVTEKDGELQTLHVQMKELSARLTDQVHALQEELEAAQSDLARKVTALASANEELTGAKSQLEHTSEEKEMLKSNFDCCMEDMTQRANERDDAIRQLQGQLTEASTNTGRSQGELREWYEAQLSEFEDRLSNADLEVQRLEKVVATASAEKEKLKDSYNGQMAELELAVQAAESESSHTKEQMSRMAEAHEKDIDDLKRSQEIQIASLEENCQSLEKALSRQDHLMSDVSCREERDKVEREKLFEQQLSDAYEQARMHEMDVSRVKRQLDEMRKDHQREQQELQKSLETQIFDLENKCVIATSEMERMRQSLWGMEQDYSGETQFLKNKAEELEALNHSQEKQLSHLQDRLMHSSHSMDDSVASLQESHQSQISHLEELNQSLGSELRDLQEQLRTTQSTHTLEIEALRHQQNQDLSVVQERCRQAESYSQVLQSHMESASESDNSPEVSILRSEIERLQLALSSSEASITQLQRKLKQAHTVSKDKISELSQQIETLTLENDATKSQNENLIEDLENEKNMLQESQIICQDTEEKNKLLLAENSSLRDQSQQSQCTDEEIATASRFVSTEEDRTVAELKQTINHLTQEMQRIQTAGTGVIDNEKGENIPSVAEGGFEPEPDSLDFLDLDESEPSATQTQRPTKTRTLSVPAEMFVSEEEEMQSSPHGVLHSSSAGELRLTMPADVLVDGFQPESPSVDSAGVPNLSFLPHPMAALPEQTRLLKFAVERSDSSTQTQTEDCPSEEDSAVISSAETAANQQQPDSSAQSGRSSSSAVEENSPEKTASAPAEDNPLVEMPSNEAEWAQRLKGVQEESEEQWVMKMRSQEVELRHSHDQELKEVRRQTERQCQQQIQTVRQETQAAFVDAVRKMRKSLEKKQKKAGAAAAGVGGGKAGKPPIGKIGQGDPGGLQGEAAGENLGEIVKQLHEENQELAEVRDVLLKQIDISQTQGRRHTMQHELQAVVTSGKFSPSQSFNLSSAQGQQMAEELRASHTQSPPPTTTGVGSANDKDSTSADDKDSTTGQSTPTAGSEEDDGSDGSCVRDRFLEELEEMSQQSAQDLPLEWELTSTSVSGVGGSSSIGVGADVFQRDPTGGSGSVWEVFDGRCLRQDCREVRHRYNNLFRWLSRVCSLPAQPDPLQGEGAGAGGSGGESWDGLEGGVGGKEEEGEGWVEAGADELDASILGQLLEGNEACLEAMLADSARALGLGDGGDVQMSVPELLCRVLSLETEKIDLERRLSSHLLLCNQEREELQLTGESMRFRCDDLESSNNSLSKQVAVLKQKRQKLGGDLSSRSEEDVGSSSDPQVKSAGTDCSDGVSMAGFQETGVSHHQQEVTMIQKEKDRLEHKLSIAQETGQALQDEQTILQKKEEVFEDRCDLLADELENLKRDNTAIQEELAALQATNQELTTRCRFLDVQIEDMADYQETVQEREGLQAKCTDLEDQLSRVQEKVAQLSHGIQNLEEEKQRAAMDQTEKVNAGRDVYEAKCSSLEKQLEIAEEANSRLSSQYKELLGENLTFKTKQEELNKMCARLEAVERECSLLESQLASTQDDESRLQDENRKLLEETQLLGARDSELKEKKEQLEVLQNQCSFLENQLTAAESENLMIKQDCSSYEAIEQEKNEFKEKCCALEKQVATVKEGFSRLQDDDQRALKEKQALDAECKVLKRENINVKHLATKCSYLEDQLAGAEETVARLCCENQALSEEKKTVSTHDEKLQEREDLETRHRSLEKQLTDTQAEVSKHKLETQNVLIEKQDLQEKCQTLTREKARLEEFESKNSFLGNQLTAAEDALARQRSENQTLSEEKIAEVSLEEVQQEIKDWQTRYHILEKQLTDTQAEVSKRTLETQNVLIEKQDLEEKCQTLTREKERLEQFESKNSFLGDQLTAAEDALARQRSENQILSEKKRAEVQQEIEDWQARYQLLEKQLTDTQAEVSKRKLETQNVLIEKQDLQEKCQTLTREDERLEELENKNRFLGDQLTAAEDALARQRSENQTLSEKKRAEVQQEIEDWQARYQLLEKQFSEAQADVSKIAIEKQELLLVKQDLEERCRNLTGENERLEEFESKSSVLGDDLSTAEGALSGMRSENQSLCEEKTALSGHCQKVEQDKDALQLRHSALEKQLLDAQADVSDLSLKNQMLLKEKQDREDEFSRATREMRRLEGFESKCSFLKDQLAAAEEMLSNLRDETATLKQKQDNVGSKQKEKDELLTKCSSLEKQTEVAQAQAVQLRSEIQNLVKEKEVLTAEIKVLKVKNLDLQDTDSKCRSLHDQLAATQDANTKLRLESQNLLKEKQLHVVKLNDFEEKHKLLQVKSQSHDDNESLKAQLQFVNDNLQAAMDANTSLENKVRMLQASKDMDGSLLEKNKALLVAKLSDLEEKHRVLEGRYKVVQDRNTTLESRKDTHLSAVSGETVFSSSYQTAAPRTTPKDVNQVTPEQKVLQSKVDALVNENRSLQEKVHILEGSNKSLKDQRDAIQNENKLLQGKSQSHNDIESLKAQLQFVNENLQAATDANTFLENKVRMLQASKDMDGNQQEKNKALLVAKLSDLEEKHRVLEGRYKVMQDRNTTLESRKDSQPSAVPGETVLSSSYQTTARRTTPKDVYLGSPEQKVLQSKVGTLENENKSLQGKIYILEQSNTSLKDRCDTIQEKNKLLQAKTQSHNDNESLKAELQFVQNNFQAATDANTSLENKVRMLQASKEMEGNLLEKNKTHLVAKLSDLEEKHRVLEGRYKVMQDRNTLLESRKDPQPSPVSRHSISYETAAPKTTLKNVHQASPGQKNLLSKVEALEDENRSLQEKIDILEESNKSLQYRCDAIQERNKLLQVRNQSLDDNESLKRVKAELQFVNDNLQAATDANTFLENKVRMLQASKDMDGNLQQKNKTLHEKCAALSGENTSQSVLLKEAGRAQKRAKEESRLLEERCGALKEELREATLSSQSLREQLHEQSMTLESVVSEMRGERSLESTPDRAVSKSDDEPGEEEGASQQQTGLKRSKNDETEEDLRQQVSKLERFLSEKEDLVAELKDQMTLLSLQQATIGSPSAQRETTSDMEQELQDLREELIEKDNVIQELQEQERRLKQALSELRRRVKEDCSLEHEVSILHEALSEKDKVIQDLKENSKLLLVSQPDRAQPARNPSSRGHTPSTDRKESFLEEGAAARQNESVRSMARSERSMESAESQPISSDPDSSDIGQGQDVDLVKEMGRLRKDIMKTKAVYANESALFQEALEREPVSSMIGLRSSRSPSSSFDFAELTQNDIPDDPEQLKRMVVKLLEQNKAFTMENLRLQLRIREQEALVIEMEERLSSGDNAPEERQSLFERQLLLLQKQRDELLHQICERESGERLMSSHMGRDAVSGAGLLHQQQEDLATKIGELEHCHQLLQQRQAELAHCQAEKRHLEQLLFLKDETERQLMRQKRLLEEELATIESKLQDREATLVEEKTRLMRELKEKEMHIFHLQGGRQGDYQLHPPPLMGGRPQSASTPRVGARSPTTASTLELGPTSMSLEAFFMQPPASQRREQSSPSPSDGGGAQGGSFLEEPETYRSSDQTSQRGQKSNSFTDQEAESHLVAGRRHSTGAVGSRTPPAPAAVVPKDPEELYKFHRDAVERLRGKLQLEVEAEMTRLSDGQAAAISGYWQRHNKQVP